MTSDSAVLWTRAAGPGNVTAELSLTPSFDPARVLPAGAASPAGDFTVKVVAPGLQAGTKNFYPFRAGGGGRPLRAFRNADPPRPHPPGKKAFPRAADLKGE